MFVFISVPPMMMIQNQLIGAAIGQNITLECTSEAFPKSINFWMRSSSKNDSIISAGKCKKTPIYIFVFVIRFGIAIIIILRKNIFVH